MKSNLPLGSLRIRPVSLASVTVRSVNLDWLNRTSLPLCCQSFNKARSAGRSVDAMPMPRAMAEASCASYRGFRK